MAASSATTELIGRRQLDRVLIDGLGVREQGVAHQTITIRCCRIDGKQQRQLTLVDLVDTQDAREVGDDPTLVINGEVHLGGKGATPKPDHLFTRSHPEVACQPIRNTARGHSVTEHRLDRLLNDTPRVDRSWAKKRRLCAKHAAAGCTHMHADFDGEHDRLIQIDIHGDARDIPHSLRIAAAARARVGWKRPTHLTNAHRLGADR